MVAARGVLGVLLVVIALAMLLAALVWLVG